MEYRDELRVVGLKLSTQLKQKSRAIAGITARCHYKFSILIEFYNKSIMKRLCTLNTTTSVDADASSAKASTKQLESRLEVIQGHAFWDH